MTGYVFVTSPCICCGNLISYNPHRVPSTPAITGEREPVCLSCMGRINEKRVALGAEPFTILPGAYEAMPEEEL